MRRSTDITNPASRRTLSSRIPGVRGTAALEMIAVLPVLIMLVLGAADMGRALYFENLISNAAREGAAYGATHQFTAYSYDDWESQVIASTLQEASNLPNFDSSSLSVEVSTADEPGGYVRVSVAVSYPFELLVDWPTFPDQIPLQHTVSMRSYR